MLRHAVKTSYRRYHQQWLLAARASAGGVVLYSVSQSFADTPKTELEAAQDLPPRRADTRRARSSSHVVPSTLKEVPSRDSQLRRLQAASTPGNSFDVLIVGGGATGSGAALDAQTRGLNTAMIERGDFGNETSARSTKLIWAGIRYIATAISQLLRFRNLTRPVSAIHDFSSEFSMVLNAHQERRRMLENNPHLTKWVPIAVPIKSWLAWPPPFGHPIFATAPFTLPAVFKFYDSLSGFSCPPSHIMSNKRARRKFPQLEDDLKYVQIFYEAQFNDARTATYIALTAAEGGATVANYVEMIGVIREEETNKAIGIQCRDKMTNQDFPVYSKAIIFAGGPFTDELRQMEDHNAEPAVNGAAGTHIVLPGYYSPQGIGMLDINTSDGRFLFFLPWEGHTLVGTTDRKGKPHSSPEPSEAEIRWILAEVEKYLSSDLKVRRADVLSAWQGWRPLARDPHAPPGAPVSRDHIISTNPDTGITFITGGKWTTYREMAQDVVDRVIKLHGFEHAGTCQTKTLKLRGGDGYTKNVPIMLVQEFGVSDETAQHLARTYGMHAFEVCRMTEPTGKRWPRFGHLLIEGFPYLECEVEYACKHEMVVTLKDMLSLRMRLCYLNKDAARQVAPRVADLMQKALGWSRRERARQLAEAKAHIDEFGGPIPNKNQVHLPTVTDLKELFRTFDPDENGYIDLTEFKDVVAYLGHEFPSDKEALKAFKKLDKDNNGRVTEQEFIDWWHHSNDSLRTKLGNKCKISADKLGSGPESRGVAFG